VGPRAGLNAVEKRKIVPCREWNPGRPARIPSLYRLQRTSGKRLMNRPPGRPRHTWENNLRCSVYEAVDWICLAQVRIQWWSLLVTVLKLWVPYGGRIS
jgi:hypothetical protein